MATRDVRKLIEDAVSDAMQGMESFVQNYQTLTQQRQDPKLPSSSGWLSRAWNLSSLSDVG
jgi:hypothetical protein